jgi:hypothetical protein
MTDKPPFPLSIADTARHLAEWQRRKAALLDFVVEFEDGRAITVGVDCPPDKLDPMRGMFWARWCHPDAVPPRIVGACFEKGGKVLASYDEAALAVIDQGGAA